MSNILDKLESLSKSATPGPWPLNQCRLVKFGASEINEDAELIAAMRNSIDHFIGIAKAADNLRRHLNQSYKSVEFSPTAVLLGELNEAFEKIDSKNQLFENPG